MDSSTTVQAPNTTANEHHSEKFGWDGTDSQLSVPPQVAVRTRSINEGIEMRVLARGGSVGDPTLLEDDDHDTSESETSSRKEWTVVIVCGLCLFLSGWQDGSLGPLIPTIQNYYGLTFTSVSVLFISGCAGFLLAAGLNNGDNLATGGVFQTVAYAVLVPALPFPVMAVAGIGLQDALANGLVTALRNNPSEKLGIPHAFYGEYSRFTLPH
ncbi:MFS general substrate transporter [Rhizoctonia solani]|uniref:MFS general substrate transporter n=1 Tax=Rhizoctonia solani TaxID=456999 RepID=A0A8H7HF73_9AGAM|nr:MFS general substrate transporter [Rhizoctonia solani]